MTDHTSPPTSERLASITVDSPVGELTVIASSGGIRAVLWPAADERRRVGLADDRAVETSTTSDDDAGSVLARARDQLEEYFAGERVEFDLPLDPIGSEFQLAAWTALCSIGYGETLSYGEQAERMGDRNKARAVGAANGKNPISIIVPCHRVVGSDGSLTGFAGGTETKRWLLDHEARVTGMRLL